MSMLWLPVSTRAAAKNGMVVTSPATEPNKGIFVVPFTTLRYVVDASNVVDVVDAGNARKNARTCVASTESAR